MKQRTHKFQVQRKRTAPAERAPTPTPAADPQRVYRQLPEPEIEDRSLRASMRQRAAERARERAGNA